MIILGTIIVTYFSMKKSMNPFDGLNDSFAILVMVEFDTWASELYLLWLYTFHKYITIKN